MSIYRKAVNNPVTTALVFAACAIFGVFSLMNISIDQLPEFDANVIMVMSSYPGASAEDIETNLSKVLENALNGVSDLKDITSQSKENICLIMLEFEWGVDIDVATNDVRDKLDLVNSELPDGASIPVIFKFSADDLPIMILSATAEESLPALEKILDDKVTTPLARVSGVGTVSVTGAPQREIQVFCDPNRLEAYGLSISTISSVLAGENRNVPSGSIDIGSDTYSVRVEKEFENAEEMLDIVVGYSNGHAVYLKDVARVNDGEEERAQEAYTDGVQGGADSDTETDRGQLGRCDQRSEKSHGLHPGVIAFRCEDNHRDRQLQEHHQQYQQPEGDYHHYFPCGDARRVCVPREMEGHLYHRPCNPYIPPGLARISVCYREHLECHIVVRPFHSDRNGGGRCYRSAGKHIDASGERGKAERSRRPCHAGSRYFCHSVHPYHAGRILSSDTYPGNIRGDVQTARLDSLHNHDSFHYRCAYSRSDALLEVFEVQTQDRKVP